jgi:hypothetical protein
MPDLVLSSPFKRVRFETLKGRKEISIMREALLILSVLTLGGCALSQQGSVALEPPAAETPEQKTDETPEQTTGETPTQNGHDGKNGHNGTGESQPPATQPPVIPQQSSARGSPWSIFTSVRNGVASNVNFDLASVDSYGAVLATGVRFDSDAFEVSYEIAGHSYTNTNRWDRVSHFISASFEQEFGDKWNLGLIGNLGFKGSSEDRDVVDRDFEFSPELDYSFTPQRRLRLFTKHRLKRYDDDPDDNAVKNYAGLEFLQTIGPRHYVELGARYETNDERDNRSDSRRWTYYVGHGIPLTNVDALAVQVRYRLKRYTDRFVEVEDEDVLRVDHRWSPSITWIRTINSKLLLTFDYEYENTYSNNWEREYRAHMFWSSVRYGWK